MKSFFICLPICLYPFQYFKCYYYKKDDQYSHSKDAYQNIVDFCHNKKEDEFVFSVSRKSIQSFLRNYYPSFNYSDYIAFVASVHLNKFLKEEIPTGLSNEEKVLFFNSVKYHIADRLYLHNREKKQIIHCLAKKYVQCLQQVNELKGMLKRLKKGKDIPLLKKKEKMILEMNESSLTDEYIIKEYEEKTKKAKKHPEKYPEFVNMTLEEWKEKRYEEFKIIQQQRDDLRLRCEFLFEEKPTIEEMKERIKEYEERLQDIDKEIQNYVGVFDGIHV